MNRREFLTFMSLTTLMLATPKLLKATVTKGTKDMKQIFEPIMWKNLRLKNRLIRSATWEGIAAPNGAISDKAYEIYEELAKGGIGAIITGFTSVSRNDFYFGGMMRLSEDDLIPQYKKLTDIIHKENCSVITQLALGAYYRPNEQRKFEQVEPDDMTKDEIKDVIKQFGQAAKRAKSAGFDGVQIHAAHFFFLSRFISPAVNHRKDEYGGSTTGRMKILLEIMEEIRKNAPDLHISIKINSSNFGYGGLEEKESLEICKVLAKAGIDSIEVSGNGTSVQGIKAHVNEGYFVDFAAKLAEVIDVPVFVVGGLRAKDTMEKVLQSTNIAALSLSRPLLREPDLSNKFKTGESEVSKCVSCNACYSSQFHRCIFRRV